MSETRRQTWEKAVEWPLTAAALLFLLAYAWPIVQPDLGSTAVRLCTAVVVVTWVLFALDYLVRLGLSRRRGQFVRSNVPDLLVVVLPLLRPLRLLRLLTLLRVLNRYAGRKLRGRVVTYVGGATLLLLLVAALAGLDAERGAPGANIESFPDALWWALATVTTVGYGDHFPVTPTGRLVATALMLAGVALLGVVTATLASWFLERVQTIQDVSRSATKADLDELHATIDQLRKQLEDVAGQDGRRQG